jgi:serine/threonine protein kinase
MSKKSYKGYKIDFAKHIGNGAFGEVYKGIHEETQKEVAVKRI